jgi:hypothetical protein
MHGNMVRLPLKDASEASYPFTPPRPTSTTLHHQPHIHENLERLLADYAAREQDGLHVAEIGYIFQDLLGVGIRSCCSPALGAFEFHHNGVSVRVISAELCDRVRLQAVLLPVLCGKRHVR